MSDNPIVWVTEDDDSAARECGIPDRALYAPAGWLEAAFTLQWGTGAHYDEQLFPGPSDIRPMIEIIDQEEDSAEDDHGPMVIGQIDYEDPGRWWL